MPRFFLHQGFWAPEQLIKDKTYKTEPDFWTLGVCVYHWTSGTMPFPGKEHDEVKDLIKTGDRLPSAGAKIAV